MYERNAIILERYFNKILGYDEKSNLKDNFFKYCNLVECSEKYIEATNSEDKIMQEYDEMANAIKQIQKSQEVLSQKSVEFGKERDIIFQNIAEESGNIKKFFDDLEKKIDENNEKIKQNEEEFINLISSFSEKSEVRNNLGKDRKKVETDYSKALNESVELYRSISKEKIDSIKAFIENSTEIEKELNEKIKKNGEKEKVTFDNMAIKNAIKLELNIQKKQIEILYNIYDKTHRLFSEIKNNNIKIDRHKKQIKDSKVKIDFLNALEEYVVQFLDNERLTAVNGENEHKKQMKEACKNFEDDLVQINNIYELLLREISGKATKKMYKEMYNVEYLHALQTESENFEREISKLNLIGTIINPNHWRIDGVKKIYDVFYASVTKNYGRDLSEIDLNEAQDKKEIKEEKKLDNTEIKVNDKIIKAEDAEIEKIDIKQNENDKSNKKAEKDEDDFEQKINMILGFDREDSKINNQDNTQILKSMMHKGTIIKDDEVSSDEDDFWDDKNWVDDKDDDDEDTWKSESFSFLKNDLDDDFDEDDNVENDYNDYNDEDLEESDENNKDDLEEDEFFDHYDEDYNDDEEDDDDIYEKQYDEDEDAWIEDTDEKIKTNSNKSSKESSKKDSKESKNKNKKNKNKGLLGRFIK